MKGTECSFTQFLQTAANTFVVPVYQRKYDWRYEQCKRLYDDLVKLSENGLGNHFFGSIVTATDPMGMPMEQLVIDGQQRITTVSLILLAIKNLLDERKIKSINPNLGNMIFDLYLNFTYSIASPIKLHLIEEDMKAYKCLFEHISDNFSDSNITINYNYFYERILRNEINADKLFEAISKLMIIHIALSSEDNPQLVFESLNSTGLDLSEGDKIRNYVLMGLPYKQQQEYYEKYWHMIEKNCGNELDSFIRDFLSVKNRKTPTISKVYLVFKENYASLKTDSTELVLQDMLVYSKRYKKLVNASTGDDIIDGSIDRLNKIKTTIVRPFFLEVLRLNEENKIDENDLREIFKIVESFIVRRAFCGVPTNALQKIFVTLHSEIIRCDNNKTENYIEKLKYLLLRKRESGRFPNNEEFLRAFSEKDFYHMRAHNKKYVLERLENFGTKEIKDVWQRIDKGDYTIEHIMPQTLSNEWRESLGDDYKEVHETWLHRIANITLTAYNSEYKNHSFPNKRDSDNGFANSGIRLNQQISHCKKWTLEELKNRDNELCEKALKIWNYPQTNYLAKEKPKNIVSLDDDYDFSGESISKFSLFGAEYVVKSWKEAYVRILQVLHSENKAVLNKIAKSNIDENELASYVSYSPDEFISSSMVQDDIFVLTNTSTQNKITVLRKLFVQFGVEESELFFCLEDSSLRTLDDNQKHLYKFWAYALPIIKEGNYPFRSRTYSTDTCINGHFGYGSSISICCSLTQNFAAVQLYINRRVKSDNKRIFDYLEKNKTEIEKEVGSELEWKRNNENKSSFVKISLDGMSYLEETTWKQAAQFHSKYSKLFYDTFIPLLAECV